MYVKLLWSSYLVMGNGRDGDPCHHQQQSAFQMDDGRLKKDKITPMKIPFFVFLKRKMGGRDSDLCTTSSEVLCDGHDGDSRHQQQCFRDGWPRRPMRSPPKRALSAGSKKVAKDIV